MAILFIFIGHPTNENKQNCHIPFHAPTFDKNICILEILKFNGLSNM